MLTSAEDGSGAIDAEEMMDAFKMLGECHVCVPFTAYGPDRGLPGLSAHISVTHVAISTVLLEDIIPCGPFPTLMGDHPSRLLQASTSKSPRSASS